MSFPPPPDPPPSGRGTGIEGSYGRGGRHGGGPGGRGGRYSNHVIGGGGRSNNHGVSSRYHHGQGRGWRGRGGSSRGHGRSKVRSGRVGGRGRGGGPGRINDGNAADKDVKADAALIEEICLPLSLQGSPRTAGANKRRRSLRIAVQGCAHGSLDRIYATLQAREGPPVDLLLCCGDFQAIRNAADLNTIAVPPKYKEIGSFWKYYSGQCKAPFPTIFVGGNHEASAYLQELFYGGWVAPNIYYLGAAGVVRFGGLRVGGLSGIYKSHDFCRGRFEAPPYDTGTLRSVYHVRNVEAYRMKCLGGGGVMNSSCLRPRVDIMLSHDWPRGIERHGDTAGLLRKKNYFKLEIQQNNLGSPANEAVLRTIKPRWWFSAHLHVKFEATVRHIEQKQGGKEKASQFGLIPSQIYAAKTKAVAEKKDSATSYEHTTTFVGLESSACPTEHFAPDLTEQMTRFLSLDKCLPRRPHLQIVNISVQDEGCVESDAMDSGIGARGAVHRPLKIEYDAEWLAVLRKTHNLTQVTRSNVTVPDDTVAVTEEEIEDVRRRIIEWHRQRQEKEGDAKGDSDGAMDYHEVATPSGLAIPDNFCITAPPHGSHGSDFALNGGEMIGNPQTDELLDMLGLDHIVTVPYIHLQQPLPLNIYPSQPRIALQTPDDNEIGLDDEINNDGGNIGEGDGQVDDNEIDLDNEEGEEEEEDVQKKKARTGSI